MSEGLSCDWASIWGSLEISFLVPLLDNSANYNYYTKNMMHTACLLNVYTTGMSTKDENLSELILSVFGIFMIPCIHKLLSISCLPYH